MTHRPRHAQVACDDDATSDLYHRTWVACPDEHLLTPEHDRLIEAYDASSKAALGRLLAIEPAPDAYQIPLRNGLPGSYAIVHRCPKQVPGRTPGWWQATFFDDQAPGPWSDIQAPSREDVLRRLHREEVMDLRRVACTWAAPGTARHDHQDLDAVRMITILHAPIAEQDAVTARLRTVLAEHGDRRLPLADLTHLVGNPPLYSGLTVLRDAGLISFPHDGSGQVGLLRPKPIAVVTHTCAWLAKSPHLDRKVERTAALVTALDHGTEDQRGYAEWIRDEASQILAREPFCVAWARADRTQPGAGYAAHDLATIAQPGSPLAQQLTDRAVAGLIEGDEAWAPILARLGTPS